MAVRVRGSAGSVRPLDLPEVLRRLAAELPEPPRVSGPNTLPVLADPPRIERALMCLLRQSPPPAVVSVALRPGGRVRLSVPGAHRDLASLRAAADGLGGAAGIVRSDRNTVTWLEIPVSGRDA